MMLCTVGGSTEPVFINLGLILVHSTNLMPNTLWLNSSFSVTILHVCLSKNSSLWKKEWQGMRKPCKRHIKIIAIIYI